ncbi:MAG TPA: anthranilate synthase component I family protein [Polyangiales bacterium]|nr:anthranilate synthase component I family protein [Polyangiales bacterium]
MSALSPSYDRFVELARPGMVVPLVRELLADGLTPVTAYATIAEEGEASFLLESVVGGEKWARYSFVGLEPELTVRAAGTRFEVIHADGRVETRELADPWAGLREIMAAYKPAGTEELPRFWGGAVGYVGYDAVRGFEPTIGNKNPPTEGDYDFAFGIGGTVLIFDNLRQTLRIVVPARVMPGEEPRSAYARALGRIERAERWLRSPAQPRTMPAPQRSAQVAVPPSSFDRASYCAAVERCKEHIAAGDIFQVVLSQRFRVPSEGIDLFDVYRAMRVINPSPYMYFLRFGALRIAGASPETLVRVEDGRAEVRPIAGTRPRGKSDEEDARIEREMFDDPKEIAEHVMLVDLGRNDVGRISVPGTVRITERMIAERYSHVMHITSNVEGRLAPGRDAIDVLRATFPAGTLSGAPKVRAMQIIEALEPERRGVYGGAIGYLGFDGNMDVAIAIRTVVEQGGELRVQAGAGIVEASKPEAEYEECVNKASAALLSIAAARAAKS